MTLTIRTRGTTFEAYCSARLNGDLVRDRRSGFPTYQEAERWGSRREQELEGGILHKDLGPVVLADLAAAAFDRFWANASGAKTYQSNISFILNSLGDALKIRTINETHLEILVSAGKKAGNSNATINRKVSCFRKMLRWAVAKEWILRVPDFETLQESRGRIRWPSDTEEAKVIELMESSGHHDYADLIRVLADTGLRVGEALALRWEDYHLKTKLLTVWISKGGKARSVPTTSRVRGVLKSRFKDDCIGPFEGLLGNTLTYLWNRAKATMGLQDDKDFVPHCLRHGVASRLVQAGVPLPMVRDILGHSRIETTMIYSHLSPMNLAQAAEVLERNT